MPDAIPYIPCIPQRLPPALQVQAAIEAIATNPLNSPHPSRFAALSPLELALETSTYWGVDGVHLKVWFLERGTSQALKDKILSYANRWSAFANIQFTEAASVGEADIRLTLVGSAYWSYLGSDCRHIPSPQPTMMLGGFTLNTPESEYLRVVQHEFGHACGWPHEHQRPEMVALIDPAKMIAYGAAHYGWDATMVTQQILTPLNPAELTVIAPPDFKSIMDYGFSGEVTKNGQPIIGGLDISEGDKALAAKVYPPAGPPPPPPGPTTGRLFGLNFMKPVPKGGQVSFPAKTRIPKGHCDLVFVGANPSQGTPPAVPAAHAPAKPKPKPRPRRKKP